MPATDDRWDVVVVGLRDPSHANRMIATAELAHYASLPPDEVERMLQDGELQVLTNLDRAEAERATHELNEIGAMVDLRLTDASQRVYPVLKPDADRQVGVAVGGLIDDSATPPTVGESRGGLPQVEPDPEEPAAPRSRPRTRTPSSGSAPAGMNVTLGSGVKRMPSGNYRPAVTRGRRVDSPETSSYGDTPGFEDDPLMSPRLHDESPGEYGVHRGGEPRNAGRGPSPGRRHGGGDDRAGARTKPKPKPRKRKPRPEDLLGELGEASPSRPFDAPKLPKRLERAAAVTGPSQGSLEIDFEGAGVARPPPGGRLGPSSPSAGPSPAMASYGPDPVARHTPAGAMAGPGRYAPGRAEPSPGLLEMLRDDWIGAFLLSLGLGLIVSMVVALQFQRGVVREDLPRLEEELALALSDPAGVEVGDRRAPEDIEDELDQTLRATERMFYFVWLGTGFSAALSLTRLRRRWL